MDLYMAGSTFAGLNEWMQDKGYNKLLSYVNDKTAIENWRQYYEQIGGKSNSKLFIDSGAFTAWTKNTIIDVDEYIDWINERSDIIALYGQIDVIPGKIGQEPSSEERNKAAEATWQNYLYMRPKMKNPDGLLYTFHVNEPYEYLKQAMEWTDENGKHIPYIALGGMVGRTSQVRKDFLDNCFDIIRKSSNPNVKTHAFGMTSLDLLTKYPITSADSTSWIMTAVTGSVFSPYGTICVSAETLKRGDNLVNQLPAIKEAMLNYIKGTEFTYEELRDDYKKREEFNIRYLQEWAKNYKPVENFKPKIGTLMHIFNNYKDKGGVNNE